MKYVIEQIGAKFVQPPIISFDHIFDQSTPMSPIVFILSPGSDPASDLQKLADKLVFFFGFFLFKYLLEKHLVYTYLNI